MSRKTRNTIECPVFGSPTEISSVVLPTFRDVMKYFLWVRHELEEKRVNKNAIVSEAIEIVAQSIQEIWKNSSIPVLSHQRIIALIRSYQKKRKDLLKPYLQRKNIPSYKLKLEVFNTNSQKLFDIAACKCPNFQECTCSKDKKVPIKEREFLEDQRTSRKMMIGSVDYKTVRQETKKECRKAAENMRLSRALEIRQSDISLSDKNVKPNIDDVPLSSSKTPPLINEPSTSGISDHKNFKTISSLAETLDRYAVSDRAGAAIASAVLKDYGIISDKSTKNVIDRHKIRRARQKNRNELQSTSDAITLQGLYFDGRKDKTLTFTDNRKRAIVEEHVVLVEEPGSKYIGHLSPTSGSSSSILEAMIQFFEDHSIALDDLQVIGCDGTNTNVGNKNGIITRLERKLDRPLQWFVYMLHANELPLRHLLLHLDGETSGPRAFRGPIGRLLSSCEKLPIVKFFKIDSELPNMNNVELSTEQRYLYDMCVSIRSGNCSEGLSKRDPGKLVHSRWLTTANRILRLYVATSNPDQNLVSLTSFIMKVYAPMWFGIKTKPSCVYGAKHVFKTIKLCEYLPNILKQIVFKVINRNGFFAHPENLLLSMMFDNRKSIRNLGHLRILKARTREDSEKNSRFFNNPVLNFDADDYYDLIDWQSVRYNEPPITRKLTVEQIKEVVENPEDSSLAHVRNYPCHTQAVERAVKVVTEASITLCGYERRDGVIRSKLNSRSLMPKFESKKDFKTK